MLRVLLHSRSAASASGGAWLSPSLSRFARAPLVSGVVSTLTLSPLSASPHTWASAVGSRALSTSSGAAGKAASGGGGGGSSSSDGNAGGGNSTSSGAGEEASGGEIPIDEPFVARASRAIWGTIKLAFGTAFFGGVLYAGYSILVVLLPVGTSSNSIMRKASDVLEQNPDVLAYFGPIKTYGVDLGGRAEGRRFFVPEYKYEDLMTGDA